MDRQKFNCTRCTNRPSAYGCIYCGGSGVIVREVWQTSDRQKHMAANSVDMRAKARWRRLAIQSDATFNSIASSLESTAATLERIGENRTGGYVRYQSKKVRNLIVGHG